MHNSNPTNSKRLSLVHRLLRSAGNRGTTTLELQRVTNSMSIATDISELRHGGIRVSPAAYEGRTANGRKVYRYTLETA